MNLFSGKAAIIAAVVLAIIIIAGLVLLYFVATADHNADMNGVITLL